MAINTSVARDAATEAVLSALLALYENSIEMNENLSG